MQFLYCVSFFFVENYVIIIIVLFIRGVNMLKLMDVAKELKFNLKIVVSIKGFDKYNAFFNIYGEDDEPCRRLVILTNDENIEEVYDENPGEAIVPGMIVDDNIWIKEYPLTTNPNKINLEDLEISEEIYQKIITL